MEKLFTDKNENLRIKKKYLQIRIFITFEDKKKYNFNVSFVNIILI